MALILKIDKCIPVKSYDFAFRINRLLLFREIFANLYITNLCSEF